MGDNQNQGGRGSLSRRQLLRSGVAVGLASTLGGAADSVHGQGPAAETLPDDDICRLTAARLSLAIREKSVSCLEVMQAYLQRISAVNPDFTALVSLLDEALLLELAREKDRDLAAGNYLGWMHGFPHAVKDLADTNGIRTTYGSPLFRDYIPGHDAIFVERLRQAGSIIIGKTNTPEFGFGSQSYNSVFGTTLNAFEPSRTAGGSSGGAASALALNLVPVADGSDMMGSLRNPAAFNNVIGFRPSYGRVPSGPRSELYLQQLGYSGPMGRNVTDTAMLLSTMAGFDDRDPLSLNQDPTVFAEPLKRDFTGTKIGWLGNFEGYLPTEKGVLDLCSTALDHFRQIGCHVEEARTDFPMDQLWQTWLTQRHGLSATRLLSLYEDAEKRTRLKPEIQWEIEGGLSLSLADFEAASKGRSAWYQEVRRLFKEHDFLVLPSAQVFPFDAGTHWPDEIAGRKMDTYHRWMEVVIGGTLSGCPVINIPAGFSRSGMPMGIQVMGPAQDDLSILQIAYAYEQSARWNLDVHPSV